MEELRTALSSAVKKLYDVDTKIELTRPEEQFGDFSSNISLQLAPKLKRPARDIADELAGELQPGGVISKTEVAGPGFLNFHLSDSAILRSLDTAAPKLYDGQKIVIEYSDPNPFKILHVGHLYTSVVGDAIANLYELAGSEVARVNFGGDIGLHVAKTIWAVLEQLDGEQPEKLDEIKPERRSEWLAECYINGNNASGKSEETKNQIDELNKRLYEIVEQDDHNSPLSKIYWTTRQWSYDYFDKFYGQIGTHFDRYYPESETIKPGMEAVKANIGKIFEHSQGAVIFNGEVHNMHTRVFINSAGLPTYETKDVGLVLKKRDDYHFDRSIVITGNEQAEYMAVVMAAVAQIEPDLAKKSSHITHGLVKLGGGVKMSSRLGNIIKAEDVIKSADNANFEANNTRNSDISLGAIKYAFLKNRIGADIIFDPAESVSLQGNSGPYLQYAYVRARAILGKTKPKEVSLHGLKLEAGERTLARKLGQFPDALVEATTEMMPHHIATYLHELAQTFNRFYENNRVIGDERQDLRLKLVDSYAKVIKGGLQLLGINVPEKM